MALFQGVRFTDTAELALSLKRYWAEMLLRRVGNPLACTQCPAVRYQFAPPVLDLRPSPQRCHICTIKPCLALRTELRLAWGRASRLN
jgi:hypothetical protein